MERAAKQLNIKGHPCGFGRDTKRRLDSLALLSLVVAVEDRFRVRIREDDAAVTRSLADLARLVAERTGAARAEAAP